MPWLHFPLNAECGISTCVGASSLSNPLAVIGNVNAYENSGGALGTPPWFNGASNVASAIGYIHGNDSSNLNIFLNNFTVSLFAVGSLPFSTNQTIVEFLSDVLNGGAAGSKTCLALIAGCSGTCLQIFWDSQCACGNDIAFPPTLLSANFNTAFNQWTHIAVTVGRSPDDAYTAVVSTYVNGNISRSETTQYFAPNAPSM
jgi:hypothetical protein